ncbi:hypothetical protein [Carnobacterium maltaromaticum]|uniref:hypothetical protein n=1 Tax=Carnobacterium maltaromaticum TaxID=2751 RepID=UPI001D67816F|nr:hypothetical protein [Carnobacterium maltaromaticum]MCC4312135.1 hypothetical protein [Carnobacterium maltaromaticum]
MNTSEQDNIEVLKEKVREFLREKGYLIDSSFEGDFIKWVGVYARPRNRPTYLDASNFEEATEQEKYSENGFKQDFSEWFEWKIKGNELVEF